MIVKILAAVAGLVLVFLGVVATRPSQYRVTRTTTIAAPPAAVFAQVHDFRKWDAWNPWAKIDPLMKQTYGGAPAGVGAVYTWAGNKDVGAGRMTLIESRPHERIRVAMEFLKPFRADATAEFTFEAESDRTIVTWSMAGDVNFVAKAIHLFIDMDSMIGGNFDKGLAQMKAVVETGGQKG